MKDVIYVQNVNEYQDILKREHTKMPLFLKKLLFYYKHFWNIMTKKKVEDFNIWVLPIYQTCSQRKLKNLFHQIEQESTQASYVLSESLIEMGLYKMMQQQGLCCVTGEKLKKILLILVLKYIGNIQNQDFSSMELTILVHNTTELNMYLIEALAKTVKSIKIVSPNLYQFKNLEEKLFHEYGIAIQFSNSFQKGLASSQFIINLDFMPIDINAYTLFEDAVIINCIEENLKIKSKLFHGVVVNHYEIKCKKELEEKLKRINVYHDFNVFLLYESLLNTDRNMADMFQRIENDKIEITSLLGNNGTIQKREFKNVTKKLDKKIKKR